MTLFGLFLILGLILLIPTAYAAKIGAPYAPTRGRAIAKAFDQVGVGQGDKVVDLGTGDGKVLLAAAQRQAQAIGFELSPIMWIIAYLRCLRKKNIKVRYQNFFKATLPEDTTYIFCFLMPQNMPQVKNYLKTQHLPAAKALLSYMFPLVDEKPLATIRTPKAGPIYVYDWESISGDRQAR